MEKIVQEVGNATLLKIAASHFLKIDCLHYTVPKEIDFPRCNMKCSGENVILRGIFHEVSCFPLHFMLYRENWITLRTVQCSYSCWRNDFLKSCFCLHILYSVQCTLYSMWQLFSHSTAVITVDNSSKKKGNRRGKKQQLLYCSVGGILQNCKA